MTHTISRELGTYVNNATLSVDVTPELPVLALNDVKRHASRADYVLSR